MCTVSEAEPVDCRIHILFKMCNCIQLYVLYTCRPMNCTSYSDIRSYWRRMSAILPVVVPLCFCHHCNFFCSPFAYVDPLHCNMAYLYLELLKDSLNEYAYAAELAGLNYDLQNTVYGMYVSIQSLSPSSSCCIPNLKSPALAHPQTGSSLG